MKKSIIGRSSEIRLLNEYINSEHSEFIAVYGRRRVGKTFLVKSLFQKDFAFYMTGLANSDLKNQLRNFADAFSQYFPKASTPKIKSWFEAFTLLRDNLKKVKGKKIIFIDELPWFDTVRADFVSALEHFWNSWAADQKDLKLIVCGSATSWMMNKLINNHGGLHNRVTHQIRLSPFTLKECEEFFKSRNFSMARTEIALYYMIFGGIPYYLTLLRNDESLAQNVDRLFFSEEGELRNEFKNLYKALFKQSDKYIEIVRVLAKKAKGFTRNELLNELSKESSGGISNVIADLESCGFIRRYTAFGKKSKDELVQLIDFYTLFYFNFVAERKKDSRTFWMQIQGKPAYATWCGYAFEILCLQHIQQILNALGISGIESNPCSWSGKDEESGIQLDLLIDRIDNVINVCEMKFSELPFELNKAYYEKSLSRVNRFRSISKTRKSTMLTFVSAAGLKDNSYARQIPKVLTLGDLF